MILGFLSGVIITFIILFALNRGSKSLYKIYYKENEILIQDIEKRKSYIKNLELTERSLNSSISDLKEQRISLREKISFDELKLKEDIAKQQNVMEASLATFRKNINDAKEEAQTEYLNCLKEFSEEFLKKQSDLAIEGQKYSKRLEDLRNNYFEACRIEKENEKIKSQEEFFKLQLVDEDLSAIKSLRQITNNFSNAKDKETVGKIIWKVYFEKPTNEMISRVIGKNTKCGIYMITNTLNGKIYIGQSVDIATRYKQHIKRGLGAESASANKLYTAMKKDGIENFSFQIIQECDRRNLSEKEKYWINFYETNTFGLNGNAGG